MEHSTTPVLTPSEAPVAPVAAPTPATFNQATNQPTMPTAAPFPTSPQTPFQPTTSTPAPVAPPAPAPVPPPVATSVQAPIQATMPTPAPAPATTPASVSQPAPAQGVDLEAVQARVAFHRALLNRTRSYLNTAIKGMARKIQQDE